MDLKTTSFSRYYVPSLWETMGVSLLTGFTATTAAYPMEFLKACSIFRSTGIGFRGENGWFHGYNPFRILREVSATGGGLSMLYNGFDAHLYGRLIYLGIRNFLYKTIYDHFAPPKPQNDLTNYEKACIGVFSGSIAAAVTNPLTVVSIRQINDWQIKPEWRRNYGCVTEGLKDLSATGQLWRGLYANILRSAIINSILTVTYDNAKEGIFSRMGDFVFVPHLAVIWTTFVSTICYLPIENIRNKMMQMYPQRERNRMNFSSILRGLKMSFDIESKTFALWAGFYSALGQMFVYTMLTVEITDCFVTNWRKRAGLLEWQM